MYSTFFSELTPSNWFADADRLVDLFIVPSSMEVGMWAHDRSQVMRGRGFNTLWLRLDLNLYFRFLRLPPFVVVIVSLLLLRRMRAHVLHT